MVAAGLWWLRGMAPHFLDLSDLHPYEHSFPEEERSFLLSFFCGQFFRGPGHSFEFTSEEVFSFFLFLLLYQNLLYFTVQDIAFMKGVSGGSRSSSDDSFFHNGLVLPNSGLVSTVGKRIFLSSQLGVSASSA